MGKINYNFLGAGKMAAALAHGMVSAGIPAENIAAYDISADALAKFHAATGCGTLARPDELEAPLVILAVKPQYLEGALRELDFSDRLVVSIVAGVSLERLAKLTGSRRIVRVMPNTPALIGAGAGAYTPSAEVSAAETAEVKKLLDGCGKFFALPETQLDAVTGLSGSGPAYVFQFIQALADGGVTAGLPRDVALALAAQTVAGAAQLVLESNEHPIALSDMVMSPGGTTAQGVLTLLRQGFSAAAADAVIAAAARSAELGRK